MKTTTKRGPGRPRLPEEDKCKSINFYLPPHVIAVLRYCAAEKKLSMAKFLSELIVQQERSIFRHIKPLTSRPSPPQ
jgi:hypothetical protein